MITAATLARVAARESELFSSFYNDYLDESPSLQGRFAGSFRQTGQWAALDDRPRDLKLLPDYWDELAELHRRLGASARSLENLERLREDRAAVVITGQQPDPLGGPLFTHHKIATAAALSREFSKRTNRPSVPVFWIASEDSDFEEIRTVRQLSTELKYIERSLPKELGGPNQMVGTIAREALEPIWDEVVESWAGLPGTERVRGWLDELRESAADLGEVQAGLVLRAFAEEGVVVHDPRLAAFRRSALPLYARYLDRQEAVESAVNQSGSKIEELGYARSIPERTAELAVYCVFGDDRVKCDPATVRNSIENDGALTGNVILRPVVQDALFRVALQIVGPGEASYLAQLREVYECLGTPAAVPFPRATATWFPRTATRLVREEEVEPWPLVRDPDATLRTVFERKVPREITTELETLRQDTFSRLERFAASASSVDSSLPQMIESARGKIDFQIRRLHEGVVGKVRGQFDRKNPELGRLRQALRPQDKPQERRLAWLDLVARGGDEFLRQGRALAELHVEGVLGGGADHFVLPIEGEEGRP